MPRNAPAVLLFALALACQAGPPRARVATDLAALATPDRGVGLPAPPVFVAPGLGNIAGRPAPMASGSVAIEEGRRAPQFDARGMLPRPNAAELASAGPGVRGLFDHLARSGGRLDGADLDALLPAGIEEPRVLVDSWSIGPRAQEAPWNGNIGRRTVCVGLVFVAASLEDIAIAQRDFEQYSARFADEFDAVYPVQDSYQRGVDPADGSEWVRLEVFRSSPGRFGCSAHDMTLSTWERTRGGLLVADFWVPADDDLFWMAGSNTFYPVFDGAGELAGHLVVSQFGLDIRNCLDGEGHVRDAIRDNLTHMKSSSEALAAGR